MKTINELWDIYRGCWDKEDTAQRICDLKSILSDGFEYRDPVIELKGYEQLSAYMEQFQEQYVGAYFATISIESHHNRGLIHWKMITPDHEVIGSGISFALFENGKLKQATGFFKDA